MPSRSVLAYSAMPSSRVSRSPASDLLGDGVERGIGEVECGHGAPPWGRDADTRGPSQARTYLPGSPPRGRPCGTCDKRSVMRYIRCGSGQNNPHGARRPSGHRAVASTVLVGVTYAQELEGARAAVFACSRSPLLLLVAMAAARAAGRARGDEAAAEAKGPSRSAPRSTPKASCSRRSSQHALEDARASRSTTSRRPARPTSCARRCSPARSTSTRSTPAAGLIFFEGDPAHAETFKDPEKGYDDGQAARPRAEQRRVADARQGQQHVGRRVKKDFAERNGLDDDV